jgi:hypothetical protein
MSERGVCPLYSEEPIPSVSLAVSVGRDQVACQRKTSNRGDAVY